MPTELGLASVGILFVFNVMCVSIGVLAFSSKEFMLEIAAKRSKSTTVEPEFDFFLKRPESSVFTISGVFYVLVRFTIVREASKWRSLTVGISSETGIFGLTATLRIFILPMLFYGVIVLLANRKGAFISLSSVMLLGTDLSLIAGSLPCCKDYRERSLNLAIRAFNTSSFGPFSLGSD